MSTLNPLNVLYGIFLLILKFIEIKVKNVTTMRRPIQLRASIKTSKPINNNKRGTSIFSNDNFKNMSLFFTPPHNQSNTSKNQCIWKT